MTDLEKLQVLLPHWITHNQEHGAEFHRWINSCEDAGHTEVAGMLRQALAASEEVAAALEKALTLAGGPALEGSTYGHHHSHDHEHHYGHHPHHHHSHHHGHEEENE